MLELAVLVGELISVRPSLKSPNTDNLFVLDILKVEGTLILTVHVGLRGTGLWKAILKLFYSYIIPLIALEVEESIETELLLIVAPVVSLIVAIFESIFPARAV